MRQFLLATIVSACLGVILYLVVIAQQFRRWPANAQLSWPTSNISLNASLTNMSGQLSDQIVIGSSTALRSISAAELNRHGDNWRVIGGFGLDPIQAMDLVKELHIRDSEILVPLAVVDIQKINGIAPQSHLTLQSHRPSTLNNMVRLRKMMWLDSTQFGHIQFDSVGNALLHDRGHHNLPNDRKGRSFTCDSTGFSAFCKQWSEMARESNNVVHLVTTPVSTAVCELNESATETICQVDFDTPHCTLSHVFCDSIPAEFFADSHHLNEEGAKLLARIVEQHLH